MTLGKSRPAIAFARGHLVHGKRTPSGTTTAPTVTDLQVGNVTQTSFTVSWIVDRAVTGQVLYGTTPALGLSTVKETNLLTSHIQTISGLTPGLLYYLRVVGEDVDLNGYAEDATVTTAPDVTGDIEYTDVTIPTSFMSGGNTYTISHTGASDASPGINAFIQAQTDGESTAAHKRIIFPPASIFRIDTAICTGGKSHMTLWGHGATSSAWRRGSAEVMPDVGAKIRVYEDMQHNPNCSAFIAGRRYSGYRATSGAWGQGGDVIIRGFDIYGMTTTSPGVMGGGGGMEIHASIEIQDQPDVQFCYNRTRGMGGDLVRFRVSPRGWVHHNYALTQGRMAGSFIVNPQTTGGRADNIFEDNTCDRAGYWFLDIETEDESTTSLRRLDGVTIRRNLFGNCGSGGTYAGDRGFLAFSYQGQHIHIADAAVEDNDVDGYGFGDYPTATSYRGLRTNIFERVGTTAPTGADPRIQRVSFRRNRVTHSAQTFAGPIVTAKYTDVLAVTDNDGNLSSGSFLDSSTSCTSVTNTGNT